MAVLVSSAALAGCTVVTIPADQLDQYPPKTSVSDIKVAPTGTSVCTSIDPNTGICPENAWAVQPAE